MKVMRGYSGEITSGKWAKCDIELDEIDVQRLAAEHNLDLSKATTRDVYFMLSVQAEIYLLADMAAQGASNVGEIKEKLRNLQSRLSDITSRLKASE